MSSEPHITNNTSQITSRYYLYIIRIHSLVLRTFAPGIHSYKLNIETISQRNRRAGRQERGTKTSAWIDGGKKTNSESLRARCCMQQWSAVATQWADT